MMSDHQRSVDLVNLFDNLQIEYKLDEPLLVQKNPTILTDMLKALNIEIDTMWETTNFTDEVFHLTWLDENSLEYERIDTFFTDTMHRCYSVDYIERVENPYLLVQYNLKKIQKGYCSEKELFHGTAQSNIEKICQENLNWRLTGTSVGHKFGQGVSFSPDSTYSSHYPRDYLPERTMFVVDVLTKSKCIGNPSMIIPAGSADTAIKPDGKVVVKFDDNEFNPKYVIYYS